VSEGSRLMSQTDRDGEVRLGHFGQVGWMGGRASAERAGEEDNLKRT